MEAVVLVAENHHQTTIPTAKPGRLQFATLRTCVGKVLHNAPRPPRDAAPVVCEKRSDNKSGLQVERCDDTAVRQGARVLFDYTINRLTICAGDTARLGPVTTVTARSIL